MSGFSVTIREIENGYLVSSTLAGERFRKHYGAALHLARTDERKWRESYAPR